MPAYVIVRIDIKDAEGAKTAYPKYVEEAGPAYREHGARFLVRGGAAQAMEGAARGRNVVIEFPDMAQARSWYACDVYAKARRHRQAVADGEMVLVEGFSEALDTQHAPPIDEGGKKGFWIARIDVRDMEPYKLYAQAATTLFEQHGALVLARGGAHEALEGTARARNVLIEFPSVDAAVACWRSKAYQDARAHRLPVSTGEVVIVEGA